MKAIKIILLAVLLPLMARAQWSEPDYENIERSIKAPEFKGKTYNVTKFGASTKKSAAENQMAINSAIATCSGKGGGRVVVPAGTYSTGAITLLSNVNLVVEEGATLLFAFEPELYPVVPTRWEGIDCHNISPCIYAYKAKNVAVTGKGTIDGGGTNDTWWKWCGAPRYGWKEGVTSQRNGARAQLLRYAEDKVDMDKRVFGSEDGLRPQLINFNRCENILIEDVTLLRSPFWVIHPLLSKNITVRGVKIDNDGPNGDGCDPESCDGVLIENCTFNTGDDCIAVKSGRNNDGRLWNLPSQNIIIRGCDMQNGHGGVVIGSEISGGCRNLYAENCTMDSPELERVVRIKTNTCRGGIIENINVRNITVGQCKEAVLKINLDYEHNELCQRGFLPIVRNVTVENVTCRKSKYGVDIIGLDNSVNVYDISVIDCHFDGVTDGNYRTGLVHNIRFDNYYLNGKPCESSALDDINLPIDRQRVVSRNNPKVTAADSLASLSVGNGHFATTVDVTGLQSYPDHYKNGVPLCTMSDWGWHSFVNKEGYKPEESQKTYNLHGRESVYAVEYKTEGRNKEATEYFRMNPHRLNLGTVGLELTGADGKIIPVERLTGINQELKLWDGMIESSFTADDKPVEVTTAVLPDRDCLFSRIVSDLLADGQARIRFTFPYPTGKHADDASDLTLPDRHTSRIVFSTPNSVVVERTLDATRYYAYIQWEGNCRFQQDGAHTFFLTTDADMISFAVEYAKEMPTKNDTSYAYDQARKAVMKAWPRFWKKGGIADFGLCADPRARELERRVVLSQYLTQINCANSMPPQETGLTYNSWFGRPHLEMTWWHALDFALWNRPEVVEQLLDWYNTAAYPEAKKLAEHQNFKGVRWMKMTDPKAKEGPSNTGSFLIWQQPHYIYLAEEMYRANPSDKTLEKYGKQVEETAEFMADYAMACAPTKGPIKLYGQTAMQESMSKDFSYNHPFEQAYWLYGLSTAQKWRERRGLPRNEQWDEIITRIAPLTPNTEGIYTSGDPIKSFNGKKSKKMKDFDPYQTPELAGRTDIAEDDFMLKSRSDHPAVLGVAGLLPDTTLYNKETMRKTLEWVMDNWNWPTTWGWDYGMIAMAAARLGEPEVALEALLTDKGKNTYLVNGHNFQEPRRLRLYLPGNGALLDAVAMMCAGWDGSEGTNPGFPADGSWNVRWENLKPMQ